MIDSFGGAPSEAPGEEGGTDVEGHPSGRERAEDNFSTPRCDNESKPNVDGILRSYSSDTRFQILQNEVYVLKNERSAWSERERDLLDRLHNGRDRLREQKQQLLEAQTKSQALAQEIELINARIQIRQESLETSYRTLCENVRLTEEASIRSRIELRRIQTKNLVLEELLRAKGLAYDQLEAKVRELMDSVTREAGESTPQDGKSLSSQPDADASEFKDALPGYDLKTATEDPLKAYQHTPLLSTHYVSNAMQVDYTGIGKSQDPVSMRLRPRRASASASATVAVGVGDKLSKPGDLVELAALMQQHLKQMITCSQETERHMKEAVDLQLEELREMLMNARNDLAYKTEECNKLSRALESMRGELEMVKGDLIRNMELQSQLKTNYEAKVLEVDNAQKAYEELESQYEQMKRELESCLLREKSNKALYDEYVKDTDAKLFKMEMILADKDKGDLGKVGAGWKGGDKVRLDDADQDKKLSELKKAFESKEPLDSIPTFNINDLEQLSKTAGDGYVKVTKDYILKLLKKESLLRDKLKEEVVRAYKLEQELKAAGGRRKRMCICRKSLKNVRATKTKRCWCKFKKVPLLKRNIASAALKREVTGIDALIQTLGAQKKLKGVRKY